MKVGKAAELSGLPVRTMHYYEEIELLVPERCGNGYRDYSDADVHKLCFLHRARGLGFSVEECRALLTLYEDDVKSIARTHLERIKLKIEELQSMRKTLGYLIHCCDGDDRPDCPILNDLAGLPAHQNENAA
jgi:MerR family copper efflux transcriptional regulator